MKQYDKAHKTIEKANTTTRYMYDKASHYEAILWDLHPMTPT